MFESINDDGVTPSMRHTRLIASDRGESKKQDKEKETISESVLKVSERGRGRGSRCCCCLKEKKIEKIKGCKEEIRDERERGERRVHEMANKEKKQSTVVATKATPMLSHRRDIQGVDGGSEIRIVGGSNAAPNKHVVTRQVPKGADG